jgi:hypothetical protein
MLASHWAIFLQRNSRKESLMIASCVSKGLITKFQCGNCCKARQIDAQCLSLQEYAQHHGEVMVMALCQTINGDVPNITHHFLLHGDQSGQ